MVVLVTGVRLPAALVAESPHNSSRMNLLKQMGRAGSCGVVTARDDPRYPVKGSLTTLAQGDLSGECPR
jgi:hypothetical protein